MLAWILSGNANANAEAVVREIFESAGVGVEGKKPGDIRVKNDAFYGRLLRDASIGLGESYMEEWWECEELDLFIEKLLRVDIKKKIQGSLKMKLLTLQALITNMQSRERARQVAEGHSVVMAAGDTFRAAAAEQLEQWADRVGADLVRGAEGGDPSSVIFPPGTACDQSKRSPASREVSRRRCSIQGSAPSFISAALRSCQPLRFRRSRRVPLPRSAWRGKVSTTGGVLSHSSG